MSEAGMDRDREGLAEFIRALESKIRQLHQFHNEIAAVWSLKNASQNDSYIVFSISPQLLHRICTCFRFVLNRPTDQQDWEKKAGQQPETDVMDQFLDPETDPERQFLNPETDVNSQFLDKKILDPETVIMDQFLDPETGEKLQFLDPETDILCQFLGPETNP